MNGMDRDMTCIVNFLNLDNRGKDAIIANIFHELNRMEEEDEERRNAWVGKSSDKADAPLRRPAYGPVFVLKKTSPKRYALNAKAIRRWMVENDVNQKQLSEMVGVSACALGQWLLQPREIGVGKVFALSEVTGVDVYDLVVRLDD